MAPQTRPTNRAPRADPHDGRPRSIRVSLTAVTVHELRETPPDPTASGPDGEVRRAPWASITACPDGPLLVRGDVEILLADGSPAPRRRSTVALCRCGASGIKPYCDGSHQAVGFHTDDEPVSA